MVFGRGKKKEAESSGPAMEASSINRLRELCGGDEELYSALSHLMFLDPKKIHSRIENLLLDAQEYEAKRNNLRAELSYRIAGGISLYTGDPDGVRKHFSKAASLGGDGRPAYAILARRPGDAVSVAKKYYENMEPATKA